MIVKGIDVIYFIIKKEVRYCFEDFFDDIIMSVYLKVGIRLFVKKGWFGEWRFVLVRDELFIDVEFEEIVDDIVERVKCDLESFIEFDEFGVIVV